MPRSRITKARRAGLDSVFAGARRSVDELAAGSTPTPPHEEGPAPTPLHEKGSAPTPILVDDQFDAVLGVYAIFVLVPKSEVAYFRLVVESWEDFAVVRTMPRLSGDDPHQQMVVVMAVPDFIEPCARGLSRLCVEVEGRQVPATPELCQSVRRDLLGTEPPGS
ncbi:MAG: hypothetical protein ABR587_00660 [Candidatus Binatia bacterium]